MPVRARRCYIAAPARTMKTKIPEALDKAGLERQSEFRYRLRCFLRFGEEAARAAR